MKQYVYFGIAALLFFSPSVRSDEAQILKDSMTDVNQTKQWNANIMEGKGRDDKAQDAEGQGNTGQAAATAAGIALMAAGIPMLASILPPVKAAGARLVAKAGQEFMQAAAMRAASNNNKGQKDLLRKSYTPSEKGNLSLGMKMTPEIEKLAAEKGVNAQDFLDQINNGNLQDPNAVLKALGESTDLSGEDKAEADRISDQAFGKVFSEVSAVVFKDPDLTSGKNSDTGTAKLGQSSPAGGDASVGKDGEGRDLASVITSEIGDSGAGSIGSGQSGVEGTKGGSSYLDELLGRIGKPGDDPKEKMATLAATLEKLGIYPPRRGQHIFERAKKNYGLFGRWRSQSKVAVQKLN